MRIVQAFFHVSAALFHWKMKKKNLLYPFSQSYPKVANGFLFSLTEFHWQKDENLCHQWTARNEFFPSLRCPLDVSQDSTRPNALCKFLWKDKDEEKCYRSRATRLYKSLCPTVHWSVHRLILKMLLDYFSFLQRFWIEYIYFTLQLAPLHHLHHVSRTFLE